jgi:hypothetical protein
MTTIVSLCVQSAYGRESCKFDSGRFCGLGPALGNEFVAFGTIRKVEAGASTFLSVCFGVSGSASHQRSSSSFGQFLRMSRRKPAPGTSSLSKPSAS